MGSPVHIISFEWGTTRIKTFIILYIYIYIYIYISMTMDDDITSNKLKFVDDTKVFRHVKMMEINNIYKTF